MPKVKISEYSATANSNTDVASINIDEGCAPSGINNAIRAVMGHLKDFQQGTNGDPFNGPVNGTLGATTPSTGAFTTLSASTTLAVGASVTGALSQFESNSLKQIKITYPSVASYFLNTNASGNLTIDKDGSLLGTFSSTGLAVTGKITTTSTANDWTNIVIGNTTSGQSYGTRIQAGTTAADYSFLVKNATNATEYFSILGNGAAAFGNGLAVTGLTDISAATSGQIKFPATQNASSNANTLDDYEEGTFTPTAVGSTTAGTGTYGTRTGVYTKIGRFVHVYISIDWSAHTGTGNLRISGLPYTAQQNEVASMFANGLTYTGTHLQPFLVGTEVWLVQTSSGAADTYIPMDTNCQLGFTIVYYV